MTHSPKTDDSRFGGRRGTHCMPIADAAAGLDKAPVMHVLGARSASSARETRAGVRLGACVCVQTSCYQCGLIAPPRALCRPTDRAFAAVNSRVKHTLSDEVSVHQHSSHHMRSSSSSSLARSGQPTSS